MNELQMIKALGSESSSRLTAPGAHLFHVEPYLVALYSAQEGVLRYRCMTSMMTAHLKEWDSFKNIFWR
jgi:hypothetical protein